MLLYCAHLWLHPSSCPFVPNHKREQRHGTATWSIHSNATHPPQVRGLSLVVWIGWMLGLVQFQAKGTANSHDAFFVLHPVPGHEHIQCCSNGGNIALPHDQLSCLFSSHASMMLSPLYGALSFPSSTVLIPI